MADYTVQDVIQIVEREYEATFGYSMHNTPSTPSDPSQLLQSNIAQFKHWYREYVKIGKIVNDAVGDPTMENYTPKMLSKDVRMAMTKHKIVGRFVIWFDANPCIPSHIMQSISEEINR